MKLLFICHLKMANSLNQQFYVVTLVKDTQQVIKPAEYEQGVFWYFDWHLRDLEPSPGAAALKLPEVDGWCWRATKADFRFEYSLVRRTTGLLRGHTRCLLGIDGVAFNTCSAQCRP